MLKKCVLLHIDFNQCLYTFRPIIKYEDHFVTFYWTWTDEIKTFKLTFKNTIDLGKWNI